MLKGTTSDDCAEVVPVPSPPIPETERRPKLPSPSRLLRTAILEHLCGEPVRGESNAGDNRFAALSSIGWSGLVYIGFHLNLFQAVYEMVPESLVWWSVAVSSLPPSPVKFNFLNIRMTAQGHESLLKMIPAVGGMDKLTQVEEFKRGILVDLQYPDCRPAQAVLLLRLLRPDLWQPPLHDRARGLLWVIPAYRHHDDNWPATEISSGRTWNTLDGRTIGDNILHLNLSWTRDYRFWLPFGMYLAGGAGAFLPVLLSLDGKGRDVGSLYRDVKAATQFIEAKVLGRGATVKNCHARLIGNQHSSLVP